MKIYQKQSNILKWVLLRLFVAVCFLMPLFSFSTHVVGGVLNYTYNGGNVYTVKLLLYRDCGPSAASLPSSVVISIRGNNGATFSPSKDLTINLGTVTTLPSNLAPCAVSPNPLPCVQEGVYTKTISLAPNVGGYHLYFQVTARNLSLTNINGACNCIGESFYAYIPNNTVSANSNSNAVFSLFPPLFICVGQPFSFNHSATDANNDSLVYSLYAPYDGDSGSGVLDPTFSSNTASFVPVNYLSGYTFSNPLGSSPFSLNPVTGVLTCTPNTIGQFVVGIKVKEYRNGVFISQTLRDFQFNVLNCPVPPPTLAINNSTINNGCSVKLIAGGISAASATWTSIFPGATGAYNNYLSCNSACLGPTVAAVGVPPAFVDFRVCGTSTNCGAVYICDTFRVTFNAALSVSVFPGNPALCNGQTSTTITAVGSGGTPPYSFLWNNVNPSQTINVGAGTYNIKLSDASGCPPVYNSAVVTTYSVPVTVNAGTNKTICAQSAVTALSGTVTGATGGLWSGGTGTCSPNNSSLGNLFYTPALSEIATGSVSLLLTSTGNGNCPSATDTVVIYYRGFSGTVSPVSSQVSCYGGTNGSASVSISGGIGPHTFTWSTVPIQSGSVVTGLPPGTFSVNLTNSIGCTSQATVSVSQPLPVNVNYTITNITCNAANNGSISVAAVGGSAPYTFSWSPGGQTSSVVAGLAAGIYTLRVTDSKLCQANFSYTLTQPAPLTVAFSQTNVSCFNGNNAMVTTSLIGGTPAYALMWTPLGATTQNLSGLSAGNYTLQVIDNMNCAATKTLTVTQPAALSLSTTVVNESCNYLNNGSAIALVTGGTPGYAYLWLPGAVSSSSLTNLSSGNYTLQVTDGNGCSTSSLISITEPPSLVVNFVSQVNVSCFAGSNGSVTANPSGGTPGYTYSWSPGSINAASAVNIAAGNYSVQVSDSKSCAVTAVVSITQPSSLSVIGLTTAVSCSGGNNGSVVLLPSGGTAPYLYFWLPSGQTVANISGLAAGVYTANVTDSKGCMLTSTYIIPQPTPISIAFTQTNASCFNGSDARLNSFVSGGVSPYTYTWSPGNFSGQNINGLTSGIYTLTVSDNQGCTNSKTVSLTQPPPLVATTTVQNESCDYLNNGSAIAAGSGGTPGYTFLWQPGAVSGSSLSGLAAGTYTLFLSDNKSCSTSTVIIVLQPAPLVVGFSAPVNVTCNGGANGAVVASPTGGLPNYTYTWSPFGGQSAMAGSLTAGTYTCLINDSHSCIAQNTITISQPAPLVLVPVITNVSCNAGSSGAISISMNGGNPPYVHTLMPGNVTAANFSALTPGNYTIITSDAGNCIANTTLAINQPINLVSVATTTNSSCLLQNGAASVSVTSGGAPPFTYSWSPGGSTSAVATGLYAGTYTVSILDNNGCASEKIINVNDNGGPLVSILSVTNVSCNGLGNGAISAGFSGGTGPSYTYSWLPSGGNSLFASTLSAGVYVIRVTDANGCVGLSNPQVLTEPALLDVFLSITPASCSGGNNGTATAVVNGGIPAYTYTWLPGITYGATAGNLAAGSYTLVVEDNNNCVNASTFVVTQPASVLSLSLTSQQVSCFGGTNGALAANAVGGTPPYNFSTFPGNLSGQSIQNLAAGNYTVIATDLNSCVASGTILITQPLPIQLSTGSLNSDCSLSNGQASVGVSGGTGPFYYQWVPSGGIASSAGSLTAGMYTVMVTDANACTAFSISTVSDNPAPSLFPAVVSTVSCFGGNNGSATVSVTGGTGPFTYSWMPNGSTSAAPSNLTAGQHTVIVRSANHCTVTASGIVLQQPAALFSYITTAAVSCFGTASGSASATACGGLPAYSYSWFPSGATGSSVIGLAAGLHTLQLLDNNNCVHTSTFTILQPLAPLSASVISSVNVSCFAGNNGSVTCIVNGGTPVFSYNWTPGFSNGPSLSGLAAGTYSLAVADVKGCTSTVTVSITQPTLVLSLSVLTSSISCFGNADGSATLQALGGTPAYFYSWVPAQGSSSVAAGLSPGNYISQVTDLNGCQATATFDINQPSEIMGSIAAVNPACGNSNGTVTALLSGGLPPYAFSWNAGAFTTASVPGLSPGNYSVLINDNNNCSKIFSVTLLNVPGPVITNVVTFNVSCFSGNNGSATIGISQGSPPFSVSWMPFGGSATTAGSLVQGSYTASVQDTRGCTTSSNIVISEPAELMLSVSSITNVSCFSGSNAAVTMTAAGGQPAYSFAWQPVGNCPTRNNLAAGNYTVQLSDLNNCKKTSVITVSEPSALTSAVTAIANALCFNGGGSATVTVGGGMPPYSYTWAPSIQSGNTILNAASAIYSVSIKDVNGCARSNTLFISQPYQVLTSVSKKDTVCKGATAVLTASATGGAGGFSYLWEPAGVINAGTFTAAPLNSTAYTVAAFDQNGCYGGDAQTALALYDLGPQNLEIAGTSPICPGNVSSILAKTTGNTGKITYSWADNLGNGPGVYLVSPGATKTYVVKVSNNCGVSLTDSVQVIVRELPLVRLATDTLMVCVPGVVKFSDQSSFKNAGDAISYWNWNFGDQATANEQDPVHLFAAPGTFSVHLSVVTNEGCEAQAASPLVVIAFPKPTASFTLNAGIYNLPYESLHCKNLSAGAVKYHWNFQDGGKSDSVNPKYLPSTLGEFKIELVAISSHGCSDTTSLFIETKADLVFPTAFTPNNLQSHGGYYNVSSLDNDVFFPYTSGVTDFQMQIFDRWGELIFESQDIKFGWDGYYRNKICQQGVYFWKAHIRLSDGRDFNSTGELTLLR